MLKTLSVQNIRSPLLKLSRWLLKWGQIPLPIVFGLALGKLILSSARDLIVSLTAIIIYFVTIVINPLSGLLLWATAYPFTETTVNISLGSSIPDLSPTRFSVAFLTAILLAQVAARQRTFPRLRGAEIAALLFVAGMSLSASNAADPVRAMQVIMDSYLIPVLGYFLIRNLILERRDLEKLFNAFLVIGIYTGAYAMYEQITGNVILGEASRMHSENIRILNGLYGDDNSFGLILGLVLPIAFDRLIKAPTLGKKLLYLVFIVTMLGGEFCTFKRTAWLSLVISLLVIQLFHPGFRRIFLALLVIFAIAYAFLGDQLVGSEVSTRATENLDTANGRTDRWTTAIELWKQKPLTGHGFKRFDDLSSVQAVENFYLHILVSAGLIGFLPLLTFILLTIKDSIAIFRQAPRNPQLLVDRRVMALFWGMLTVYLIVSFNNYMAVAINHILPYILMGAIVGSQSTLLERKKRAKSLIPAQATL